jgi:hypothetical protein
VRDITIVVVAAEEVGDLVGAVKRRCAAGTPDALTGDG